MLRNSEKGLNVKIRLSKTKAKLLFGLAHWQRQLLCASVLVLVSLPAASQNQGGTVGGLVNQSAIYQNEKLNEYVNQVGTRIVNATGLHERFSFEFHVLSDASTNAMATEDGFIFVTLGMLALITSEDQLAAILGHEIAHVTRRHLQSRKSSAAAKDLFGNIAAIGSYYATGSSAIARVTDGVGGYINEAWITGYGRKQELDADAVGAKYLIQAGYRHEAMLEMLTLTKQEQLLQKRFRKARSQTITYHGVQSTHPAFDKRLQEVLGMAKSTPMVFNEIGAVEDWLDIVDGLPFGVVADEGISQNNRYLNRSIGLDAQFPPGWEIKTAGTNLISSPKGEPNKAYYLLKIVQKPDSDEPEAVESRLRALLGDRKLSNIKPITSGRMQGISTSLMPDNPHHKAQLAALIYDDTKAYLVLAALGETGDERPWRDGFHTLIKSIGTPSEDTAFQAGRYRIEVIFTKSGDSYESLVEKIPNLSPAQRAFFTDYLRLINGDHPRGKIGEGERIKVIL